MFAVRCVLRGMEYGYSHTSGRPMEGEAKVYLAVQPPGKGKKVAVSEEVYPYVSSSQQPNSVQFK